MRIVHLNRDDFGGGAYRSAWRLNAALQEEGLDSRMVVGMKRSRDQDVHALAFPDRSRDRAIRIMRRTRLALNRRTNRAVEQGRYEAFDDDRSQYGSSLTQAIPACEVLNLHFVSGLLDYASCFPAITDRAPVVWVLHDMNPFTGGCHFDDNCDRWTDGCGCCPQLGSCDRNDLSARSWRRKLQSLGQVDPERIRIVAPSKHARPDRWQACRRLRLLRGGYKDGCSANSGESKPATSVRCGSSLRGRFHHEPFYRRPGV